MRTTSRSARANLVLMSVRYRAELGQAIQRRRKELGLTQKDLADRTHYREAQAVSRWERGENLPRDLEIVAIALDWTLAELVAGIEPPDRRVARRLGIAPPSEDAPRRAGHFDERLDAIQRTLDQILELLQLLTGETPADEAAAMLEGLPQEVAQAAGLPQHQAPAQSGSTPAAAKRKTA